MINDIGYLESGFSEEFSNSIGLNEQSDELLNEESKKKYLEDHPVKQESNIFDFVFGDAVNKSSSNTEYVNEGLISFIKDLHKKHKDIKKKEFEKAVDDEIKRRQSEETKENNLQILNNNKDLIKQLITDSVDNINKELSIIDEYYKNKCDRLNVSKEYANYTSDKYLSYEHSLYNMVFYFNYPWVDDPEDEEVYNDFSNKLYKIQNNLNKVKSLNKYGHFEVDEYPECFSIFFYVNKDAYDTKVTKQNESYYSNGTADIDLDYYAAYESYLATNIYNETKIQNMLVTECGLSESAIILEARTQDDVSNNWERFLNFIGRVYDRFVAAYEKHVMSNKKFLEKYKDNIVNTKGSDDVDYEYTGDYFEGINRIQNTQLPVFNYERDAQWLRQEGYEGAIKDFMAGKNFKYDPEKDMAEQFKNWFMAAERGTSKGKLSGLNFKVMFDFCYNYDTLKNSIERDIKGLRQSKNLLINAVNKEMRERGQDPNKQNNQQNNQPNNSAQQNNQNSNPQTNVNTNNNNNTGGGTTANSEAVWLNINEADDNANGNNNDNNSSNSNNGGLTISNSDNETKDANGNTVEKKNKIPGKTNSVDQDIKNIVNKWTKMCRCFLTAKLTITQLIGKDFMNLIRAHLRAQNVDTSGEDEKNQQNNDNNNNQHNNNQNNNNNTGNNQQNNKNNNG